MTVNIHFKPSGRLGLGRAINPSQTIVVLPNSNISLPLPANSQSDSSLSYPRHSAALHQAFLAQTRNKASIK